MKKIKILFLTIFLTILLMFLLSATLSLASAQENSGRKADEQKSIQLGKVILFWDGEYRLRYEWQDHYNIEAYGTTGQEDFLLSKLQLNFYLRLPYNFSLVTQFQDAEILGSSFSDQDFNGKNSPYHDPFDINVAYLSFNPMKNLELKVGRQIISLGDRRVFGPGQWGNTGRYAWDAVVLTYRSELLETTILTGRFVIHDPDHWPNKMASGPTACAVYNSIKNLPFTFDVFYVYKWDGRGQTVGESGSGNLCSHSAGFRVDGHYKAWDYNAIYVKQFGKWGSDHLAAHGLVASLGYNFKLFKKTELQVMYVLGSGDGNPTDGRHQTFDGIFSGADTIMYDWMTLVFWKNLRDHRLNLIISPAENLTLRAEYHYFLLDKAQDAWYDAGKIQRRDITGDSSRSLGQEIDLIAQKKLLRNLEILAGYCFFLPGQFVKLTGPTPQGHWLFLQTTINF
jgi:hypothetical protein